MADSRNSTTKKVLRTQLRVAGWTTLLTDVLSVALVLACWLGLHLRACAGGVNALLHTRFTVIRLAAAAAEDLPVRLLLHLQTEGMPLQSLDVTGELAVLLAGLIVYWLVQHLASSIAHAIGRQRIKTHMQQVALLAQEARQLSEEAARRPTPQVDVLEEAIDHISPTESTRLHIGDPDLKGLEDAVNDLLDRMQAAYSQQARFVSDASHELRTPIAVLKGYADLLERWGKDDPQVRDEAIGAIQAEAQRMSRLVEQLLFLARGDSGRTQLRPEPLDLSELAREAYEEFKMIDGSHCWALDAPEPVPCEGDRDMLKQALRVLGDNASKYTPDGKSITLRAFTDGKGQPCLSVRDEGMGIKREDAAHVFERFYRSDPARTRQGGGAGLGLSIADWIVTRHGGHMEVYSWEGIGSRFTIVLQSAISA